MRRVALGGLVATIVLACGSLQAPDATPTATEGGVDAAVSTGADASTDAGAGADADAAVSRYVAAVLADHPILYYRLGENAGEQVARDAFSTTNNGSYETDKTLIGGAIAGDNDTATKFGDGDTRRVVLQPATLPSFKGKVPFSVEAWVSIDHLPPSSTEYANVVSKESSDNSGRQGWSLFLSPDGKLAFERFVNDQNPKATAPTPAAVGVYHHVVAVYDGAAQHLWVDGVQVATQSDTGALVDQVDVEGYIGNDDVSSKPWFGAIDEVAIYDHALSDVRIQDHHQRGITP